MVMNLSKNGTLDEARAMCLRNTIVQRIFAGFL